MGSGETRALFLYPQSRPPAHRSGPHPSAPAARFLPQQTAALEAPGAGLGPRAQEVMRLSDQDKGWIRLGAEEVNHGAPPAASPAPRPPLRGRIPGGALPGLHAPRSSPALSPRSLRGARGRGFPQVPRPHRPGPSASRAPHPAPACPLTSGALRTWGPFLTPLEPEVRTVG